MSPFDGFIVAHYDQYLAQCKEIIVQDMTDPKLSARIVEQLSEKFAEKCVQPIEKEGAFPVVMGKFAMLGLVTVIQSLKEEE